MSPKYANIFDCSFNLSIYAIYGPISLCFEYDVFAIIALELMAISLGLGASGAPEMTPCPLNVQISLIVASIFHISAVYGPIGLCFGYDAPVGFCYHISRAYSPIISFGVLRGP